VRPARISERFLAAIHKRLGAQELRRRLLHIAPGFLPFILWPIPHRDPLGPTLRSIMIALAIGLTLFAWRQRRRVSRNGERGFLVTLLSYTAPILTTLLFLPAAPELGLAVLAIVAFGDGCATLVGRVAAGPRLPWNRAKTWAGSAAFVACALPIAAVVYWGEAQPHVSLALSLACAAPAALVAALAESLNSRVNDNLRVGVAAAVTIAVAHAMFVGR
jgi:dolichol kinase